MGGSVGKSNSDSSNQFSQNVFGPQGNALSNLYDLALNQYSKLDPNQSGIQNQADFATNQANQIASQAGGAYGDLTQGGAYGDTDEIRSKLLGMMEGPSQTGQMYESIVGGQGNEYADPLIERLRQDAALNADTLRNTNALDAAAMGQSGSSRHAMENAMTNQAVNRDLLNKEAEIRHGAYDRDLDLKMGIANMADANKQAEQDRLLSMLEGSNATKATAVDQGGLMQQLGLGGFGGILQGQNTGWNNLNNLANIIGPAIITGSGKGGSSSKGFGTSGSLWG
ncbi:hypothetical protein S1R3Y_000040 [Vibrio phage vB_ValP_VA-RY-3]|nr:hypothetical protein S1R3Y_000040 [Vibrio phage vB_ValP_VA-RY-3]